MEPPPPAESQKSRSTSPTSSVASSVDTSNTEPAADGEYRVLLKSLDEESLPLPPPVELDIQRTLSKQFGLDLIRDKEEAIYGHPLTPEEAAKRMPPSNEGFSYHATIIPDEYFVDGKLKKGLNQRDFDVEHQKVKPRRPSLPITASDFFSSLTKVDGPNGPRYILYGILNGWPSLRCFELERLEVRRSSASLNLPTAKELLTGQILWKKTWSAEDEGRRGVEPKLPSDHQVCRAKLRGAPWTAKGWREDSPGFVFWYEAQRKEGPRVVYGTDLTTTLGDDRCTMIHMISHRYAVARETPRDRLTYHSVCLLEWEHGEYCTVVEAAYLNGIGGYKGKSNWYHDKDEKVSSLYKHLPPELISPWRTTSAEIRCYDVEAKNLTEFKEYIEKYRGSDKRFVDPHYTFSHPVRLSFRSKKHLGQYLINYIMRDSDYAELSRNCQTFTADLCAFMAGKKNISPFHPVSRIDYQNRTYLFLYDAYMYANKRDKFKKQQAKK